MFTIGWASVRSAPLSLATAAIASVFVWIADHIYSLILRSAAVMSVKTNTRLASPLIRFPSFVNRFPASSAAGDNSLVPFFAPASCPLSSPAFLFALSRDAAVLLIFALIVSTFNAAESNSFCMAFTCACWFAIESDVKNSAPLFICSRVAFAASRFAPSCADCSTSGSFSLSRSFSFSDKAEIFLVSVLSSFCACLESISVLMIIDPSAIKSPPFFFYLQRCCAYDIIR